MSNSQMIELGSLSGAASVLSAFNDGLLGQVAKEMNQAEKTFTCGDFGVHLQMVHVQDATYTFRDDLASMKREKLIETLLQDLQDTYGSVDYALATFGDKPGPLTGSGSTGLSGFMNDISWASHYGDYGGDRCFDLQSGLSAATSDISVALDKIKASGGKDFMENQWDALYRSASYSDIGWNLDEFDSEGKKIIRFALLVTDDSAHVDELDDWSRVNQDRNPYYETTVYGPQQSCQVSADSECYGPLSARSGIFKSLKGNYNYWNNFYGKAEWEHAIDMLDCDIYTFEECATYNAFVSCCTDYWYMTGLCSDGAPVGSLPYNNFEQFPTFAACSAYGGRYTSGSAYDHLEPSEAFIKGQNSSYTAVESISPYSYSESGLKDADCGKLEYPNPRDSRFGIPFAEKDIIPIIIAAPPSHSLYSGVEAGDVPSDLSQFDPYALRSAAHVCPGLPHDPWMSYICTFYPSYHPECADMTEEDLFCSDQECQNTWWTNCILHEYGGALKDMKTEHPEISGMLSILSSDYSASSIVHSIKASIAAAMERLACPTTSYPGETTEDAIVVVVPTTEPAGESTSDTEDTTTTTTSVDSTTSEPADANTSGDSTDTAITDSTPTPSTPAIVENETTRPDLDIVLPPGYTMPIQVVHTEGKESTSEEEGGNTVAIVVGSAVGGVAAVGAAAAAAFKGVLPGFSKSAPDTTIEDTNVEHTPLDREQMVDVQQDMFA